MSSGKLRCPACRSRRALFSSMAKHIEESGHQLCGCRGYHYKHRPGSPCCDLNTFAPLKRALRVKDFEPTKEELQDLWLDCTLHPQTWPKPTPPGADPPF